MKKVYPVYFTQTETNILIEVPDLEILTEADRMSDAIEMARDAIELKCVSLEDAGEPVVEPSDVASLDCAEGTFAADGQTILSLVDADPDTYRRKIDTRTVRRNVALPGWLNYEAEQANVNVSRILQEALMNVLHLERRI